MTAKQLFRYQNDAVFHNLVQQLRLLFFDGPLTKRDVVEAAEIATELMEANEIDDALCGEDPGRDIERYYQRQGEADQKA
jgi:hypothetical protein